MQFQELCTDVYDELIRRKTNASNTKGPSFSLSLSLRHHSSPPESTAVPFLPAQAEYHPKRNQARQKLSGLPTSRYQDLCSDLHYDLIRRYPECKEGVIVLFILSVRFVTYHFRSSP